MRIAHLPGGPIFIAAAACLTACQSAPKQTAPDVLSDARRLSAQGRLVEARASLNAALKGSAAAANAALGSSIRDELTRLNDQLLFSLEVAADDPYAAAHVIQPGDTFETIAPQYKVPWRLLQRINRDVDPMRLRIGAPLKVIHGPFHAVARRGGAGGHARLDLYVQDMFVRSWPATFTGSGIGAVTTGEYRLRASGKLESPSWANPRTGQRYASSDPANPVGRYFLALEGADERTRSRDGFGLHDPAATITAAEGTVVLPAEAMELLFQTLIEAHSKITVAP